MNSILRLLRRLVIGNGNVIRDRAYTNWNTLTTATTPAARLHALREAFVSDESTLTKCRSVLSKEEYSRLCALVFIDVFAPTERVMARAREVVKR